MNRSTAQDGGRSLEQILEDFGQRAAPLELDRQLPEVMRRCLADGQADLPLPGQGQTLQRWRALAQVAGNDLALLKLFEGHTDAKAILAELGALHLDSPGIWGVWAAEPPTARVRIVGREHGAVQLSGTKAWCSGALQIDHALLTAWNEDDRPQLVALALTQGDLRIDSDDWQARGMATTASVSVHLDGARAHCVGPSGAYVQRPVSGMAVPASPPAGTAPRGPWPRPCAKPAPDHATTPTRRRTWVPSMPPWPAQRPGCASARRGSMPTPGPMPSLTCAVPAPWWRLQWSRCNGTSAGHWAPRPFAVIHGSPG